MSETTIMIKRRIRHWKTTVAGVLAFLAPVACIIWPEYAGKIRDAALMIAGGGLIAAPDAKNTDPNPK